MSRNDILSRFCPRLPSGWTIERIGDCLKQTVVPVKMIDSEVYRLVSIRRRNGGMFDRQRLKGEQILTKDLQKVLPNSFAIARRQIIHGACTFVGPEFEDAVLSSSYSIFLSTGKCDARYFSWLAKHPLMYAYYSAASHGIVIEKMNFDQERWLDFTVHLPPIQEQLRIAEILESMDESVRTIERLLTKARQVEVALKYELSGRRFEDRATRRLDDLLHDIQAGKSPDVPERPAEYEEWGVLKVSAVRGEGFAPRENKVVTQRRYINKNIEVKPGDLLITRANTPELVGLACHVRETRPRLMLSDKTLRLVVNSDKVDAEYLAHVLATPSLRHQIESSGTGSSGSMKNISQKEIRSLVVPCPPVEEQRLTAARIRAATLTAEGYEHSLAKLSKLKRGLMEDLLIGRVRVNAGESATE